jgi:hypothetical protein
VSGSHIGAQARRVVSGVGADGKSVIVVDEMTKTRVALPAFTSNDVWRADRVPTTFDDDDLREELEFGPAESGIIVRLVTFPPDSEVDQVSYDETIDRFHGRELNVGQADTDVEVLGMHAMDTVDIDTVLNGELWCVFDSGEQTLLRAGDTIINRGTTHAWSNRTHVPVTVVATVISVGGSAASRRPVG